MKKIFFFLIICTVYSALPAQTIFGTIYDAQTRETVPGVAVYFDGTTIIATSDKDGKFKLEVEKRINARLVFSHLSYEVLIIDKPFENENRAFYLKEKVNTLDAVRVVADRYSRAEKMQLFKEQFLGKSAAGRSCVILNEEVISLSYDYSTNTLMGRADQPIVVQNKYLAYLVSFDLHDFHIHYSDRTLNMNEAIKIVFLGTSSFVDQSPYNVLYAKRREETYLKSSQNFWKNFVGKTLEEEQFKIYNKYRQMETDEYFIISDWLSLKRVVVIPDTNLERRHSSVTEENIFGVLGVTYKSQLRSEIVFLTNTFTIDSFGNPDAPDKLMYFGDMGGQRLGEMLPQNYVIQ